MQVHVYLIGNITTLGISYTQNIAIIMVSLLLEEILGTAAKAKCYIPLSGISHLCLFAQH